MPNNAIREKIGMGLRGIWHKKCEMLNRPGRLLGGDISAELFLHRID